MMVEFVNEDFLLDFFSEGVSIVGNAQSLREKEYGKLIDARKTIRFNWPKLDYRTGTRLDCLFCSLPKNIPNDYNFHLLISRTEYSHNNKYQYKIKNEDTEIINKIIDPQIDYKRPSNGILCLYLLDKLRFKNVHIFGFDWKETPSTTSKPNKKKITKKNDHDYESEKCVAFNFIEKNEWKLYK
jgi:hypothetical protein